MTFTLAEYTWIDGAIPTRTIRSKAKAVQVGSNPSIEDFPEWSYDGSSTNQAAGSDSDCIIKPVQVIKDPIRGDGNFLVMCEVFNPDGTPHSSNSRAQLREVLDAGADKLDSWIGFEQEYTLFDGSRPLGWPENGYPGPQGPYYCGAGAENIFGRDIAEDHARLCLDTELMYYGMNAEVMPGQWEFQVGFRGDERETAEVLKICDHMWLARYLLHRVGENYGVTVSFENKPIKGDWNGAGMHTNFSTADMRNPSGGIQAIRQACEKLEQKHAEHIAVYGFGLHERLLGTHETCDINTFKVGDADRGCSIRIPKPVSQKGYGYFEDRRPGANADPYLVAARLCSTIAGLEEKIMQFRSWPREQDNLAIAAE